ncbi:MOSC domain-containing protein [Tessaracoccus sp. HDW20]|nr:MOSC domain-containing protein [Tessaracoccus coleopterorum]
MTQPRSPCYKLAKRWGIDDLVLRAQATGWVGWYLRVLEPGTVTAGAEVVLLDRPGGAPPSARCSA